jgi:integrase
MIWNVPPEHRKLKNKKNGKVLQRPITKSMLAILDEMQKRCTDWSDDALVFPGPFSGKAVTHSDVSHFILHCFKWETKITAHGLRSTLKDWCRVNEFPMDWYEIQVDHVLGNSVGQAYGHDTLLDQRRDMMEAWGEYCSTPAPEPKAGEVIPISSKRRSA